MSKETLERLSKPLKHKEAKPLILSFSWCAFCRISGMCRRAVSPVCTFAPETKGKRVVRFIDKLVISQLCEKSKELVGAREKFHERIDSLIANHRKAMSDRAKVRTCTDTRIVY
ncbi:hypothetical protein AAMO2058_001026700 [Amorphochlora amoebiformis]